MNNEETLKMTELDHLTAAPHLQMIKAALPYIQIPEQRFFSLFIKVSELERTMKLFDENEEGMIGICSLSEDEPATPLDMLNAMKPYGTQGEQEFIDLIVNFLQSSKIYQSYKESLDSTEESQQSPPPRETVNSQSKQGTGDGINSRSGSGADAGRRKNDSRHFSLDQFKNILPPEQQSKLETAQLLMQTFQQFS
ncbi:MAG: hypothetical protein RSE05_10350 [Clostridium sp.]